MIYEYLEIPIFLTPPTHEICVNGGSSSLNLRARERVEEMKSIFQKSKSFGNFFFLGGNFSLCLSVCMSGFLRVILG